MEHRLDKEYTEHLTRGLEQGITIGVQYGKSTCKSARENMKLAAENKRVAVLSKRGMSGQSTRPARIGVTPFCNPQSLWGNLQEPPAWKVAADCGPVAP